MNGAILAAIALAITHAAVWHYATTSAENRMAIQWQAGQIATWKQATADAQDKINASATAAANAQRQRDQLSKRLAEIDRAPPPPPAPGCDRWTNDQRLRLESRRAAHAAIDDPRPGLLLDPLPTDAPH